ncbi:hypothetical protein BDV96DRAFT_603972 [Lophiotrema nucula]|uniref:C3H1-type domain-containing protein n=1 Tax=Lophiotrema nucula TaxID=690887 RepID=A0A6A5YT61_9PLEO|nr:hypothetical protein BDV96DRAFT_603972 [Lophiotrema nucula]
MAHTDPDSLTRETCLEGPRVSPSDVDCIICLEACEVAFKNVPEEAPVRMESVPTLTIGPFFLVMSRCRNAAPQKVFACFLSRSAIIISSIAIGQHNGYTQDRITSQATPSRYPHGASVPPSVASFSSQIVAKNLKISTFYSTPESTIDDFLAGCEADLLKGTKTRERPSFSGRLRDAFENPATPQGHASRADPKTAKYYVGIRPSGYGSGTEHCNGRIHRYIYGGDGSNDLGLCYCTWLTRYACQFGEDCVWRHDQLTDEEIEWFRLSGDKGRRFFERVKKSCYRPHHNIPKLMGPLRPGWKRC